MSKDDNSRSIQSQSAMLPSYIKIFYEWDCTRVKLALLVLLPFFFFLFLIKGCELQENSHEDNHNNYYTCSLDNSSNKSFTISSAHCWII